MDAQTLSDTGGRTGMRSSFESQDIEPHRLRFTGSGGEYFRVWIVNVLLSIVTLGFYTPWARRRTAQYFYGHTLVAGSPLEFTAQQRRMVVGFLVVALLTLAYNIASNTGQDVAVGLFILGGAARAPQIGGSAMRFRLANTRWRGLRLAFTANWREVYTASWPVFALALVWLAVAWGLQTLAPPAALDEDTGRKLPTITAPMWGLIALGLLLSVLCVIRLEFNYRSLLVLRSRIGDEPGRWKPVYLDFVKLWLATLGVFIASVAVLAAVAAGLLRGSWALFKALGQGGGMGLGLFLLILAGIAAMLFVLLLATAPARAYREAALFRLTWSHIGVSRIARFKCQLRVGAYILLRLRNMLLTLVTLGFFRPFAMVSEYRMKLESVTLYVKGGVDQVAGRLGRQQPGGIGDALADAAGLDLIG
jgi:uncharacterized membrane protein YjgN (DUF898 family)